MAKDPAFLFYYQDWLVGTYFLRRKEKGAYMDLLCYQADRGPLSMETIKEILNSDFEECWPRLREKFQEEDGYYYNKRLLLEQEKRKNYTESRRRNLKKVHMDEHMLFHMENENENENINENKNENNKEETSAKFFSSNILEFEKLWNIWKEYRKKEHKFMYKSSVSESTALARLVELAGDDFETAKKIIMQSIQNGWKGLFELKHTEKENKFPVYVSPYKNE